MASPSFDLLDVVRALLKRKGFIILVTAVAVAIGAIFHFVKKKKYVAEARFLVNNPIYGDRNTIFRNVEQRYVDYFGGDDDLDRITALASSDTVRDRIIRNCDFDKIYKFGDMNKDTSHAMYMSVFAKNFNLKRTEYKDLVVSYIAYEPKTAAGVANMSVQVLEETFRHYYTTMKHNIIVSINSSIASMDTTINRLTDSLANMREKYNIYAILNPGRQNVINGELKGGGKGYGLAMEQIQNVESIKDQLVADRARDVSVLNEFAASANDSMDYLKVITRAVPPTSPTGPSLTMTMMITGGLGLFFSVIYVLMMAYFRKLNELL